MKPRKPNESDESYIARLEASNAELRKIRKMTNRISRSITWLGCDISLAFQSMAEKAGVRSHPSVTAVVQAIDVIVHPQWQDENASIPDITFPTDWDLDPPDAWSGDADMGLNAGIAAALEYLDVRKFKSSKGECEEIQRLIAGLERPLQGVVENVMPQMAERKPIEIAPEATREDLAEVINAISWRLLDLAQDMSWINTCLRRDLRAAAYRRICHELYQLVDLHVPIPNPKFSVTVLGNETPF